MTRRPRVLLVGPNRVSAGGMSSVVARLEASTLSGTHEIVCLDTYKGGSLPTRAGNFARAFGVFLALMAAGRIDLIHLHSASRGSFLRKSLLLACGRLFGKPVVLHLHGGEFGTFYERAGRLQRWLIRTALNLASEVVVVTESWQRQIAAIKGSDRAMTVVMNPVNVGPRRRRDGDASFVRVLFLGRIHERKGAFDLLECARRLAAEAPHLRFTLCGDGRLEQARAFIARHGLDGRVSLPGWVADPSPYLSDAHMFVLPSYAEGLPVSILEAESWGLPIITTRVGGIPDVVRDGENGFLIEPGDVEALTDRIRTLASDRPLRQAMGEQGYALVKARCREEVVIGRLRGIYDRLLAAA